MYIIKNTKHGNLIADDVYADYDSDMYIGSNCRTVDGMKLIPFFYFRKCQFKSVDTWVDL